MYFEHMIKELISTEILSGLISGAEFLSDDKSDMLAWLQAYVSLVYPIWIVY